MRSSITVFIAGLIFILLTDTVFGIQIRRFLRKKWQLSVYVFHSLFFIISVSLFHFSVNKLTGPESYFWIGKLFGVLLLFYTPKLFYIILYGIGAFFRKPMPGFYHFMRASAGIVSVLLFVVQLYSITGGRYNYRTETVEVPIHHLPASFNDFKVVQLSDLHLGSYGESYKGVGRLVEEVNALQPDLIVFTGDMVNNFADEMPRWIPILRKLNAPYGKYAVTGNHDYGDYTRWASAHEKQDNMQRFYRNMEAMGFQMLNNTHVPIVRQGDTLWIAGVENWGRPPFPRYGKLTAALEGLEEKDAVILLSHDPSHWRAEVLSHAIPLTLSGHTHAMQMGIRIGNKEWSPSQYIYPEYDGLYKESGQYLHVSRGQGYLGYPGRIGLRPVITLLSLKATANEYRIP